ncbi:hypothetical protein [Nocardiopsis gilva]|nr:hypothetical protein [Nocardiopsis gilva]
MAAVFLLLYTVFLLIVSAPAAVRVIVTRRQPPEGDRVLDTLVFVGGGLPYALFYAGLAPWSPGMALPGLLIGGLVHLGCVKLAMASKRRSLIAVPALLLPVIVFFARLASESPVLL